MCAGRSFPTAAAKVGELRRRSRAHSDSAHPAGTDDILAGSAMMTAAKDGIASYLVECGGRNRSFTDETVWTRWSACTTCARARHARGQVTDHGQLTYFSDFDWVTSGQGGLFQRSVRCGERVEKGSVIGQYYESRESARRGQGAQCRRRACHPLRPDHGRGRDAYPYRPRSAGGLSLPRRRQTATRLAESPSGL